MSTGQIIEDEDNKAASAGYDPTSHQVAALQIGAIQKDPVTGTTYGVLQISGGGGGGSGLSTNDGTFARETGGNLATLVTQTTGLATQTTLAAAKTDLDTIVTNTGHIPTLGQATMANSVPVTLASNQPTIPVTTTFPTEQAVNINQVNGTTLSIANPLLSKVTDGTNTLALNASGQLAISNFPTTQPVSGTVSLTNAHFDGSGNLNVNVQAGGSGGSGSSNASVGTDGSALPTSSTLIGASDGTNLQQLLVESSSSHNLRASLYQGTNEAIVSAGGALKVDGSSVTQPVSGTITVNAGSNLNTSFLALETGGNLAAIKADTDTIATNTTGLATQSTLAAAKADLDTITTNTGHIPVLGQATMANSVPVTIASNQSAVTVTANAGTGNFTVVGTGTAGAPGGGVLSIQGVTGGQTLPISGTVTNPSIGATGSAIPTSSALLGASDGTNLQQLLVESSTNRNLRTSLYQGANEATISAGGALKVDGSGVTQPISGTITANAGTNLNTSSLALETGGNLATLVTNTTGLATQSTLAAAKSDLDAIAINTGHIPSLGQATMANSVPVTLASNQSTMAISGTITANAGTNLNTSQLALEAGGNLATLVTQTLGLATQSTLAAAKVDLDTITTNTGHIPSLGQATMANSVPVTLASNQSNVTISGTVTANAGTNLNTSLLALETGGNLATIATNTGNIPAKGQSTKANSTPVAIASDQGNLAFILTDKAGSNQAVVDSAGNQWVRGGYTEQASLSAAALNADLVPSTDISAYSSWSLQITAIASGATLTFQGSNDGSTFNSVVFFNAGSNAAAGTSVSATGMYYGPKLYRYLRVRQTAWTAGTTTGVLELNTMPYPTIPCNTTVQSNSNATASNVGTSDYHLVSAGSTNTAAIKASSGQVYGYDIFNAAISTRYVKLFNKASAPTLGTDIPLRTIAIPNGSKATFSSSTGIKFTTGIAIATTTGIADTDSTAVTANDLVIDIDWL